MFALNLILCISPNIPWTFSVQFVRSTHIDCHKAMKSMKIIAFYVVLKLNYQTLACLLLSSVQSSYDFISKDYAVKTMSRAFKRLGWPS